MTTKLGSVYQRPGWGRAIREVVLTMLALFGALAALGFCAEAASGEDAVVTAGPVVATELPTIEACPFSPGWNLTVLNGVPGLLPSCVSAVWYYEGRTERWYFWGRDNEPFWNDLVEFKIENGYWIWRTQ